MYRIKRTLKPISESSARETAGKNRFRYYSRFGGAWRMPHSKSSEYAIDQTRAGFTKNALDITEITVRRVLLIIFRAVIT